MAKKAANEPLVVASKVRAYIKSQGCMTGSKTMEAISEEVRRLLNAAVARAKANERVTVRPADL